MKVTNFTTGLILIVTVSAIVFFMGINKMGSEITCQLLVIILIFIEMMLIMISVGWLHNIRLTCTSLQRASQDFSNSFTKGKEEIILLHKKLTWILHEIGGDKTPVVVYNTSVAKH